MPAIARFSSIPPLLLAAAILAGCPPRKTVKSSGSETAAAGREDALDPSVEVEESVIRGKTYVSVEDVSPIYFEFDRYELSNQARVTLRDNAAYLKAHPDLEVLVEGHCDERGTLEYNLALGQKRASAVREYYIRLGVPGRNVGTISFGEERPACSESTEACWTQNRRASTKIRSQVSSGDMGEESRKKR